MDARAHEERKGEEVPVSHFRPQFDHVTALHQLSKTVFETRPSDDTKPTADSTVARVTYASQLFCLVV